LDQIPLFDWPPREPVVRWLAVQAAFAVLRPDRLPFAPQLDENVWAPPGMDQLGGALRWAIQATEGTERSAWMFQLGAWLAGRNKVEEALAVLAQSRDDRARALSGRLHLHCRARPDAAAENFRAIQSEAVAMHPQVAIERDIALAALGVKALDERGLWFAKLANCADEWLIERRAAWLVDAGKPEEARRLIESTAFQLVHQRYERTKLWARLAGGQGPASTTVPSQLGEDDLAAFGAYREVERKS
jgi:hypothetical protein